MTIKVIKNPARNSPPVQKNYVPNYKRMGREPEVQEEIIEDLDEVSIPSHSNVRGNFPNSGNTQDYVWTSTRDPDSFYDTEFVISENPPNPYVTFNQPSRNTTAVLTQKKKSAVLVIPEPEKDNTLKVGEFILMINDDVVCVGNENLIKERITLILSGDDPVFQDSNDISADDFVVLKRVNVSVGVLIG
jgi:hypothetical protein